MPMGNIMIVPILALNAGSEASSPVDVAPAQQPTVTWAVGPALLLPGVPGTFDETAVKDPSVVCHGGTWHVFYTARGQGRCSIGHVAAEKPEDLQQAPRHCLTQLRGRGDPYAAAPQVFWFEPQQKWYLIHQTRDARYQPVYSTTKTIDAPDSWTAPADLVEKCDDGKWIDFWVICDDTMAYLFFTRNHHELCVMKTTLASFPAGFTAQKTVFAPLHEAAHIYKVDGHDEYHLIYEMSDEHDFRRFGITVAPHPLGPWATPTEDYADATRLRYAEGVTHWTDEVSHGEVLRAGYDQRLAYDPKHARLLIQGMRKEQHAGDYADLPWRLGLIRAE